MLRLRVLGALAGALLLASCTSFGDVEDVYAAQTVRAGSGDAFNQALAMEYNELVKFEQGSMHDWNDAALFARKQMAAERNQTPLPEEVKYWSVPHHTIEELEAARVMLMGLYSQGAREIAPRESARAQARFDCWLEEQEEAWQHDRINACRDEFYAAIRAIEDAMRPPVPAQYIVYFDFDRSNIRPDARAVLEQAVADARQGNVTEFSVTGHTDTAGPREYNIGLSIRRANAVKDALVQLGVPAAGITVAGRGQSELAVPTADNVPEQGNRRAVIVFQ